MNNYHSRDGYEPLRQIARRQIHIWLASSQEREQTNATSCALEIPTRTSEGVERIGGRRCVMKY